MPGRGLAAMQGDTGGMSEQEQMMVKTIQTVTESCAGKTVMAGAMGLMLGGAIGLFMSSMSYDTPMTAAGRAMQDLPVREQLKRGFRDMGSRSFSTAKNFAVIGALFQGTECCIEGFRAKNEMKNSVAAGCISGGLMAARAGPQAAAVGCVGFAAFSTAFEYYMHSSSD